MFGYSWERPYLRFIIKNKPMKNDFIKFRIDSELKAEAKHIIDERGIESFSSICVKAISDYVKKYDYYLDNFKR